MGSATSTADTYALEEFVTPVIVAFEAAKAVQTSSSSASQSPTSATTSGIAETTSAPEEQPSEKSLSTGAKASIGAAVSVCVIAMFATIIFILRRKAKRRAKNADTDESFTKAELPAESKHNTELDLQGALHEAGSLQKPAEAENSSRAELEGDWTGWEAPVLAEIDLSPVEAPSGTRVEAPSNVSMERPENHIEGRQTLRG
jgi:cytoskeletal protein RodZ